LTLFLSRKNLEKSNFFIVAVAIFRVPDKLMRNFHRFDGLAVRTAENTVKKLWANCYMRRKPAAVRPKSCGHKLEKRYDVALK